MKNRILKKKIFTYKSGRIKLKSKVQLTEEEIIKIFKIIRKYLRDPFYGYYYRMSREIVHEIDSVNMVEIFDYRIRLVVKIW